MNRFLAETSPEQVAPERFLTGRDLIEMGFRPGPQFKEILNAAEDAQLNGVIPDRDAAQRFVVEHYGMPTAEGMPSK
jgi:poly(A) polymerase